MSKYGVFSGPYFPAFGLSRQIYYVNPRIQSEYGKYGPEKLYLDTFHIMKTTYHLHHHHHPLLHHRLRSDLLDSVIKTENIKENLPDKEGSVNLAL